MSKTAYIIGRRIAALRKGLGLTQAQLAERMGKTVKTVNSIEGGRTLPSIETLLAIARVFNISPALLLEDPVYKDADPNLANEARQELYERLFTTICDIDDESIRHLVSFVGSLKRSSEHA